LASSKTIIVKETSISIIQVEKQDYISLTDMIKSFGDESIMYNWLRNRNTIEFLGLWEQINNNNFKPLEFDRFKMESGLNRFSLSPKKWIEATSAIGIISKSGRYGGGTYAHKDIAFEFGSWLSAEFKLYLIKEFQRLKDEETSNTKLEWNLQRTLSKINYRIHTDAIKEALIPPAITKQQSSIIYASEADVLNMALFGQTAATWRTNNKTKEGNIRDHATLEQLVVLTNLESINAVFIKQALPQSERLKKLNDTAISQMKSLLNNSGLKKLK
jgi:hypothetical protein